MATTTSTTDFVGHADTTATAAPKRGFFGRMFDRMVEARMGHARLQVAGYLARLSDDRLKDLGFTPDETKALRAQGTVPLTYWC